LKGEKLDFEINSDNILTFKNRIYVPNQNFVKQLIMDEFHGNPVWATQVTRNYYQPSRKGIFGLG